uniref:Uncharacterized protein n=1 Tax=Oryza rufipogon TaxID=4529 RepID=A0A0E0NA39_ORYRU
MELLQSLELTYGLGTPKDGELMHKELGICPIKLLLLALRATRLFITLHVVVGNFPVNKLLEMFST